MCCHLHMTETSLGQSGRKKESLFDLNRPDMRTWHVWVHRVSSESDPEVVDGRNSEHMIRSMENCDNSSQPLIYSNHSFAWNTKINRIKYKKQPCRQIKETAGLTFYGLRSTLALSFCLEGTRSVFCGELLCWFWFCSPFSLPAHQIQQHS